MYIESSHYFLKSTSLRVYAMKKRLSSGGTSVTYVTKIRYNERTKLAIHWDPIPDEVAPRLRHFAHSTLRSCEGRVTLEEAHSGRMSVT